MIAAPVGAHSAKPDCFAELIERLYPTVPKIELFRRGEARPNWSAWGNEAEPAKAGSSIREAEPAQPAPPPASDSLGIPGFLRR